MALIIAKAPTCGDPHAVYLTSLLQTCYISTAFVLFESLCFGVLRFIFQIVTELIFHKRNLLCPFTLKRWRPMTKRDGKIC